MGFFFSLILYGATSPGGSEYHATDHVWIDVTITFLALCKLFYFSPIVKCGSEKLKTLRCKAVDLKLFHVSALRLR